MNWSEDVYRFHLDHEFILDQEIQSISTIQPNPLVFKRQRTFAVKCNSTKG